MAIANLVTWDKLLKTIYTTEDVQRLLVETSPTFDLIAKDTKFGGASFTCPIIYGGGQGVSSDISVATSNARANSNTAFTLTRKKLYGVAKLENELLKATQSDKGAFVEAVTGEVDPVMNTMVADMSIALFGNGGGSIGRLSSTQTLASTTLVLADPNDARNYEVGTVIQLASTDGTSGSVRTGTLTIVGVNRSAGTLTTDQNISTGISAAAQSDYIFRHGNFGQGIKGLSAYIPASAPSSGENFLGVDRSVDERLYGLRMSANGGTIEEALINAGIQCSRLGASSIDTIILSPQEGGYLIKELGSKAIYNKVQSATVADFGYDVLTLHVPMARGKGSLKVAIDPFCPAGTGYLLTLNSWKIRSLGEAPQILTYEDGGRILRASGSDAVELQFAAYWNISCNAPGKNMRITF